LLAVLHQSPMRKTDLSRRRSRHLSALLAPLRCTAVQPAAAGSARRARCPSCGAPRAPVLPERKRQCDGPSLGHTEHNSNARPARFRLTQRAKDAAQTRRLSAIAAVLDALAGRGGYDRWNGRKLPAPAAAPRLNRIQAASTRGVRACIRRVAGCATADRLRRPRWRNGQPQTNIPPGPLSGADQDCKSSCFAPAPAGR
jgi:hypothetical protein